MVKYLLLFTLPPYHVSRFLSHIVIVVQYYYKPFSLYLYADF